jgi:hypothetical protein
MGLNLKIRLYLMLLFPIVTGVKDKNCTQTASGASVCGAAAFIVFLGYGGISPHLCNLPNTCYT